MPTLFSPFRFVSAGPWKTATKQASASKADSWAYEPLKLQDAWLDY